MVWRWDYSGYSLVCGGGVWCVHILHTCVWVCGWGVGMAVMCWGRRDDSSLPRNIFCLPVACCNTDRARTRPPQKEKTVPARACTQYTPRLHSLQSHFAHVQPRREPPRQPSLGTVMALPTRYALTIP